MFTKIQEALDALRPGQVVKILDRGPYDENIDVQDHKTDCGLVSEVGTVVQPTQWARQEDGYPFGHRFENISKFRLSGLAFPDVKQPPPSEEDYSTVMQFFEQGGSVIEDCFIHSLQGRDFPYRRRHTGLHLQNRRSGISVVRRCIVTKVGVAAQRNDASILMRENQLGPCLQGIVSAGGDHIGELLIYNNVFHGAEAAGVYFDCNLGGGRVDIVNNSFFVGSSSFIVRNVNEERKMILERNCGQVGLSLDVVSFRERAATLWRVRDNWWGRQPSTAVSGDRTLLQPIRFLSQSFKDRDYLRVSADSPRPPDNPGTYYGALPPGPAPPEGDWFTRLRERWQDVLAESQESSDKSPEPK